MRNEVEKAQAEYRAAVKVYIKTIGDTVSIQKGRFLFDILLRHKAIVMAHRELLRILAQENNVKSP